VNDTSKEQSEPRRAAVGYGKPPKATQFQKGKSGNPSGRPKGRGRPTLREALERHLDREVTAQVGGKTVRMTLYEAMIVRICSKADLKTFQFIQSTLSAPKTLEETMAGRPLFEFTEAARVSKEVLLEGVGYRYMDQEGNISSDDMVDGDGQPNR
jgi:hypothetical protein